MARVAYFGYPARSHTVPSLALVQELVRRGVEVDYYSTARFGCMIQQAGARFVEYGSLDDGIADPDGVGGMAGAAAHARRLAEAAKRLMPELLASVVAGRPDVIVFDASAYWGALIAQEMRAPRAAFVTTFGFTQSMLGLLGVTDPAALEVLVAPADLRLVCTSRYFQPSGRFFDASHLFVGPLIEYRRPEGIRLSAESRSRPLAYVSLGTIFNRDLKLLRSIAGTLAGSGWQVAVALGGGDAGEAEWPPFVRAYGFVDQWDALGVADLAVTHGGMASVSEIAARRVPAIVVPQALDQFVVAKRAASLGAAVVVEVGGEIGRAMEEALVRVQGSRAEMVAAAGRIADSFAPGEVTPMSDAAEAVLKLAGAVAL